MTALIIRTQSFVYLDKSAFYGLDESTVIYAEESQINTIKELFKGLVLPLSEYEANNIFTSQEECNAYKEEIIYNMSGQRLSTIPEKGIYIYKGRKIIAP